MNYIANQHFVTVANNILSPSGNFSAMAACIESFCVFTKGTVTKKLVACLFQGLVSTGGLYEKTVKVQL